MGLMGREITRDPEIMHGTPVFRGTRVPIQTLFDYLEGGDTLDSFLEGFPTVSREQATEALKMPRNCCSLVLDAAANRRVCR